ncbi:MAG: hypothetical protein QW270_06780 [Candidatus Bathyarchaeia archaeon]
MDKPVHVISSKCVQCKHVPCIDFFKSWGELEGGELFLFNKIIEDRKFVPCIVGASIYTLCQCTLNLSNNEETTDLPITHVLLQCIRDLKCSVFLAIFGHYRHAMQTLRPVFENFLAGLFFTYLEDYDSYMKWLDGEYIIPRYLWKEIMGDRKPLKKKLDYEFCLEFMGKRCIHSKYLRKWEKQKQKIKEKIIGPLNKYLHPYFPSFEIALGKRCAGCPAAVKYDEEKLKKWIEVFQRILFLIFDFILQNYWEQLVADKDTRTALLFLVEPPDVKKEFMQYEEYRKLVEVIENYLSRINDN